MKIPKPKLLRWSRLREVGNSSLVQLTVLIPLVGYLIIFNERIAKYLELAKEVSAKVQQLHSDQPSPLPHASELSVSPRLLMVYFGLCLISFGALIYRLYCPEEVKNYATSTAFVGGDGPDVGTDGLKEMESEIFRVFPDDHARLAGRFNKRVSLSQLTEDYDAIKNEFDVDLMHLYFLTLDESKPWLRATCGLLLVTGVLILSLPAAQVFCRVAGILWGLLAAYLRWPPPQSS